MGTWVGHRKPAALVAVATVASVGLLTTWHLLSLSSGSHGSGKGEMSETAAGVFADTGGAPSGPLSAAYPEHRASGRDIDASAAFHAQVHRNGMLASRRGSSVGGISAGAWAELGPANEGGRVRSLLIHPTAPMRMWVGAVTGGIWKSDDGGANWAPVDPSQEGLSISCLVMDPTDSSKLYACTGEWDPGWRGGGILQSADGGETWTTMPTTANSANWMWVNSLAIDPNNGQHMIAATSTGAYTTFDGGGTWTQTLTSVVRKVEFHPTDGNQAVAGGDDGTIWFTRNGAAPPVMPTDPPPWTMATMMSATPIPRSRVEVTYCRANPSFLYASIDGPVSMTRSGTIWQSMDGGATFSVMNQSGHLPNQGHYNNALWCDPTDTTGQKIVTGGTRLWRSLDGGTRLTEINAAFEAHADHHQIVAPPAFDGTSNKTVYMCSDGGPYRTDNIYASRVRWTRLTRGLRILQFYRVAVNPAGRIIGGTQDQGTYLLNSGAPGWTRTGGGDGWTCGADPVDTRYFYLSANFTIGRSSDGGATDFPALSGLPSRVTVFALDPNEPSRFLAAWLQVQRTADVRQTDPAWETIKQPIQVNPPPCTANGMPCTTNGECCTGFCSGTSGEAQTCAPRFNHQATALAIAEGDSNLVWVAHENGDVFKSTNALAAAGSVTWTKMDDVPTMKLPDRPCHDIVIDRHDHNRVYIIFGPYGNDFVASNVWKTDDGGTTWISISGGPCDSTRPVTALPCEPARSLTVHPDQPGWLYVGTVSGLYASEDDGDTWQSVPGGPGTISVDDLVWQNDATLVVATHGRGVYRASGVVPDCNGNGVIDLLELAGHDCDGNLLLDACEAENPDLDCDGNGKLDRCEIRRDSPAPGGPFFCDFSCDADCNDNGIVDDCEPDCDGNGNPDDCDLASALGFPGALSFPAGLSASEVVSGDLNADDFPDFVVANWDSDELSVLLNLGVDGSGNWLGLATAVNYPLPCLECPGGTESGPAWTVALADVERDGDLDILTVAPLYEGFPPNLLSDLVVMMNDGIGAFSLSAFTPAVHDVARFRAESIAVADFNHDGFPDAAIANTRSGTGVGGNDITIVFNLGRDAEGNWLGFLPPTRDENFPEVGLAPASIAAGRFNLDPHFDLATANETSGDVTVLINDGDGVFSSATNYPVGDEPKAIAAADLNADGLDDLVVVTGVDVVKVLLNAGDGTFGAPGSFAAGAGGSESVAVADFDLEGSQDILVGHNGAVMPHILLNSSIGVFGLPFPVSGGAAVSLAVADVDRDGDRDFAAVGGGEHAPLIVVLNSSLIDCDGNGVPDPCEIAAGRPDVDDDGLLDECERGACDVDADGDCDLADWRRLHDCWRGPGISCSAAAGVEVVDLDGDFDFDLRDFALFQNRFTGERNCCAPHGPGCAHFPIQACVCAAIPSCCELAWTSECVAAVDDLGCGDCIEETFCGDGNCDTSESCASCKEDCGDCAGACCAANGSIGCERADIEQCVCAYSPICCTEGWSESCASIASTHCTGCCGEGTCGPGEDCWSCPADCGECEALCGNDLCEAGEDCVNCALDCRSCGGSCCVPHGSVGCDNPVVQDCVCTNDPSCCLLAWHEGCAAAADACGSCDGPCCAENDSPGCDEESVEACVCMISADCCVFEWDAACVALAAGQCLACTGDCGDHQCSGDETCATCSVDCGECTGSCCQAHPSPGCVEPNVQACVCSFDSPCCEQEWNAQCAAEARQCGSCTGDCCVANGTPGCDDSAVQDCVCAQEPFCCEAEWNANCAALVEALQCGACP